MKSGYLYKNGVAEEWWSHTVDNIFELIGKGCGVSCLYFEELDNDMEKKTFSAIANKPTTVTFDITIIIIIINLNSVYLYI
jgi:hypothetical protein